jgi:hypothetical protein
MKYSFSSYEINITAESLKKQAFYCGILIGSSDKK